MPLHTLEGILWFQLRRCAVSGADGRLRAYAASSLSLLYPARAVSGAELWARNAATCCCGRPGTPLPRSEIRCTAAVYARSLILGKVYNARWGAGTRQPVATGHAGGRGTRSRMPSTSAQLAAALRFWWRPARIWSPLRGLEGEAGTAVLRPVQHADLTAERCLCVHLPQPQTAAG